MDNTFDQCHLSQLNLIVTECSKQYFLIKNQLYDQIHELQESSMSKIDICHLIDTQHTLIKELGNVVKYLFTELSFRKCIIERKEHVLKDLNAVMINKFIDKIYKQEQLIIELQKKKIDLQPPIKMKSNNKLNKSNTNNQSKSSSVNVIAPKSKVEYNGTVSFFNSSIKNIERFINIKTSEMNEQRKEERHKRAAKLTKTPPKKEIMNQKEIKSIPLAVSQNSRPMRPKSVESCKNVD